MTITRAGPAELRVAAEKIFGLVIADIREELNKIRIEQTRLHESLVAMNTQLVALDNKVRNEFDRSENSRRAILKRVAELENKSESSW